METFQHVNYCYDLFFSLKTDTYLMNLQLVPLRKQPQINILYLVPYDGAQLLDTRRVKCKIKNPAHFIVKESPDINTSSNAKKFVEAEEMMQKYYHSIEAEFFQLPLKDSVVVVLPKKKYYRAQVLSILNVAEGHLIKVYLLDYGQECNVPRQCPVSTWDGSATAFIEELQKAMNSAHIKIKGVRENFAFGSLYLTFNNQEVKCINEQLILKQFAQKTEDFWNDITAIDVILSKMDLHHTIRHPGIASEDEASPNLQKSPNPMPAEKQPKALTVAVTPTVTALSPNSQNKPKTPLTTLQKLKMLKKKSPVVSPNITPVSPNLSGSKDVSSIEVSSGDAIENVELDQNKTTPMENKSQNETPSRVEIKGMNHLQKLKNLRKALPSQKAPDSSTPLTSTIETCTSLESPVLQTTHGRFPSSVIDGISPITGIKPDVQSPVSDLSAVKDDTNSLNTAFRDSIQPKDEQKVSELSINENEKSNINKVKSPPISTSKKLQNLKNLYKKRNSLPANPEAKPSETISPKVDASSVDGSDSDVSLSRFGDSLNEGFSDLDDTQDLLQSILDPKNNTPIDSSVMSSPDSSITSSPQVGASSLDRSDSDVSLSRFGDSLNEGFSDLDDTGDLLRCILDPKNNTPMDSSVMRSPDSRTF